MNDRHLGLVVEDDPGTADDLLEIVASLDCDVESTDNKQTAIALIEKHPFCFVLLDLHIKREPESIKGHIAHGNSLLREIRLRCGGNKGSTFWTPTLVISGYAEEVDAVVEMMKNGADDIIRKPPLTVDVAKRIRTALQQAGRENHAACRAHSASLEAHDGGLVIGFPADRERRRTRVTISGRDVMLPDSSLKVLLYLAVAREKGEYVHKRKLGAKGDQGFKGISRLRDAFRPMLDKGVDIVDNDQHGGYSLIQRVTIGECDASKLRSVGDIVISELAETLSSLTKNRAPHPTDVTGS